MTPSQRAIRIEKADLAIEVFPERKRIEGVATLDLLLQAPLADLTLDLDANLPVSAISVDGTPLAAGAWSNPDGRLNIRLPSPAEAGERLSLRIAYGGTPHVAVRAPWDGGFVWSQTVDGKPFVATAVQGEGCDLFWPCLDHPSSEPALLDLHITVPAGLAAPANGALVGIRELPDGRRTYDWRARNINSYGVAIDVGPYQLMSTDYRSRYGNSIRMEYWHLPENAERAKMLFAEFAPSLDFFEAMIGPYPFGDEKVGVVETPHLGMEHQTINAYGNGYARDVYGFDWLFHHEFAHEWFANQLTAADNDDAWLHEGFGTYMQPLYARWRGGEIDYLARMHAMRGSILNCFPIVRGPPRTNDQVSDPALGPSLDIYYKAAWVLHTLRGLIGDKAFFAATRRLVYGRPDPRPGNFVPRFGSTDEFARIVREEAGRDYGWFFDAYLRQAALPELLSERRGERLVLTWKVVGGGNFPMPVEVRIGEAVRTVPMAGGSRSLAVPAGAHAVVDPFGKILKRSRDVEALQLWQYEEAKKAHRPGQEDAPRPPCIPG